MNRILSFIYLLNLVSITSLAQTKNYALKGNLSQLRKAFDVRKYEITLKVNPAHKSIVGSNSIKFKAVKSLKILQLDLYQNLIIDSIKQKNSLLTFNRVENTFYVNLNQKLAKNDSSLITIYYHGIPTVAKNAPWDGGFVWSADSNGTPWVGLACEGVGASVWLPCKDHWSDEAEEVTMHLQVPKGLMGVSNGKFIGTKFLPDNFVEHTWQVSYPINNYNISVNIGDYTGFFDEYIDRNSNTLALNYYVLKYNYSKALTHFQQVKRMLACFEKYVGVYPFIKDGYKLVETPYWGMEHQSCIAYGNNYQFNNFGFDFIIIHESGHEWFANSLTAADPADVWIHESFTTYLESLFVECTYGDLKAKEYINTQKDKIKNKVPMVGDLNTYWRPNDNDVYYKGAWMLNTLRNMLQNDTLWFNTLQDLTQNFKYQTINTQQVLNFLCVRLNRNVEPFFKTYLYQAKLPVFEYYIINKNNINELHYRITNAAKKIEIPLKVKLTKDNFGFVTATKKWQLVDLNYFDNTLFEVDTNNFLINTLMVEPR